eukprot:13051588-Ditylum_brightwellii.AAC.1
MHFTTVTALSPLSQTSESCHAYIGALPRVLCSTLEPSHFPHIWKTNPGTQTCGLSFTTALGSPLPLTRYTGA